MSAPAYGGADDASLPAADRAMVTFWHDYKAGTKTLTGGVTNWLSMVRQHLPRAFRYIVNSDTEAAGIAVRRRWTEAETRPEPTPEEVKAVGAAVKAAIAGMAEARVQAETAAGAAAYGARIDAARAEAARAFEVVNGRKPGELHPVTLGQMRDATPSVQRARTVQAMKPPANDVPPAPKPPDPPQPPTDLRLRRALAWGDDP